MLVNTEKMMYVIPVISVALFIILTFAPYRKARPDESLIISGLTSKPKAIVGKSGYAIPFLQRVDRLPLVLTQIDVKTNRIPTCEIINVNVCGERVPVADGL